MNLKPLGDRVIVEAQAAEEKTESGILLAKSAQEKPQRGTVLAVGEGKFDENGKRIPVDVQVGDTIIYGKYSGSEVKIDGKDYLIMRADDIYAVVQ